MATVKILRKRILRPTNSLSLFSLRQRLISLFLTLHSSCYPGHSSSTVVSVIAHFIFLSSTVSCILTLTISLLPLNSSRVS